MNDILLAVFLTLVAVVVARFAFIYIVSGGNFARYKQSQAIALKFLKDPTVELKPKEPAKPKEPVKPVKPSAEPLWLLSVLQRDGRLVDFLLENLEGYDNEQIAAAVRDLQPKCQKVLKETLELAPVLPGQDGDSVTVPAGFDPSAIRLTGAVTGQPPFTGSLRHAGWRVAAIKLHKPAEGQDQFVVQPAEVELS